MWPMPQAVLAFLEEALPSTVVGCHWLQQQQELATLHAMCNLDYQALLKVA